VASLPTIGTALADVKRDKMIVAMEKKDGMNMMGGLKERYS
jgi:hypothetical protein